MHKISLKSALTDEHVPSILIQNTNFELVKQNVIPPKSINSISITKKIILLYFEIH